jgi:hypothetical protein
MTKRIIFECTIAVFVIALLVFLQYYFMEHLLFNTYPYTGVFLHFIGGICVALISKDIWIILKHYHIVAFSGMRFVLSIVFITAVAWEIAEILVGWSIDITTQNFILECCKDIAITFLGGFSYTMIIRMK